MRLHECSGSSEAFLFAYAISTKISYTGPYYMDPQWNHLGPQKKTLGILGPQNNQEGKMVLLLKFWLKKKGSVDAKTDLYLHRVSLSFCCFLGFFLV